MMANLFTLKIRWRFFLALIVFFCLLPFCILPFFNIMVADDYLLENMHRQYGFFRTQQVVYTEWTGRFTATFLGSLFTKTGIVQHYYYLHSFLLLFFTFIAFFFLLSAINKHITGSLFSKAQLTTGSFLLLFLNIYTQADIASGFFWFSAAITYQTAFILFLLLSGCMLNRFCSNLYSRWWNDGIIIGLILLICGCNEIAAVFLVLFLSFIIAACYYFQRTFSKMLVIYFIVTVITGLIIACSSGVLVHRQKIMNASTSYWTVLPMIVFRSLSVFYFMLKDPFFWIASSGIFLLGGKIGSYLQKPVALLRLSKEKKILLPGLLIIVLLVMGTLTPVLLVSKGSLPLRSLNNLVSLTLVFLLALFFLTGIGYARQIMSFSSSSFVIVTIVVCGLIANVNYIEAWKSVFSGYFYHSVMSERHQLLLRASENKQRIVTIPSYNKALTQKINQVFPKGIFVTVKEVLQEPPRMFYHPNEAENPRSGYLKYYGLDKIVVVR